MEQISNIQENEIVKHERNYKDKLFRKIYGTEDQRSARWRLELYNALSGKNHTDPDELEMSLPVLNFLKMPARNFRF